MKKNFYLLVLIVVVLGFSVCGWAQLGMFSSEQRIDLTREWKGDRFPDGRPKVSDDLLKRMATVERRGSLGRARGAWILKSVRRRVEDN